MSYAKLEDIGRFFVQFCLPPVRGLGAVLYELTSMHPPRRVLSHLRLAQKLERQQKRRIVQ